MYEPACMLLLLLLLLMRVMCACMLLDEPACMNWHA